MEIIHGYRISASNNSAKQRGSITVKNEHGQIAARIHSEHTRPLVRVRTYLGCEERADLIRQLTQANVEQHVIDAIVAMPKKTG